MASLPRIVTAAAASLRAASARGVARVRADTTTALRGATARVSAFFRPAAPDSPRWRAAVRPAIDAFLRDRPAILRDLLRRTRPAIDEVVALLRDRPHTIHDLVARLRLPRRGPGATEELLLHRPIDDHAGAGAGPWDTFVRRLQRLRRRRAEIGSRRPLASDPNGDEVLDIDDGAEDDDERGMLIRFYLAVRRLRSTRAWKQVEDVLLDLDRIRTLYRRLKNAGRTPHLLPRKLPVVLRPRTADAPPRAPSAPRVDSVDLQDAQWLVIACIPRVQVEMPAGIDVVFRAAPPPLPSSLEVGEHLSGAFTSLQEPYPYVSAVADRGHMLLLHARPEPEDGAEESLIYVCDVSSGIAILLPAPETLGGVLVLDRLAIVSDGEDEYRVFGLQPGETTVHCYDSRTGAWSAFPVAVDGVIGEWDCHGVVAQGQTILWYDLRVGFLWWELDGGHVLRFVPLPPGRARPPGAVGLGRFRCATLCEQGQQVLYAEILDAPHRPLIQVQAWSRLSDGWLVEGSIGFDRVWEDPMYASTGLPRVVPSVALIGPDGIVYALVGSDIYAIDVRRGCVVAEASLEVEAPPPEFLSSRFVRSWRFIE